MVIIRDIKLDPEQGSGHESRGSTRVNPNISFKKDQNNVNLTKKNQIKS
jgi:hypothetical protein